MTADPRQGRFAVGAAPAAAIAAGPDESPTARGFWETQRDSWTHPREWSIWNIAGLAALVLLLAVFAIWAVQPGNLLGGAEPLNAQLAASDLERHSFVYELSEPPAGRVDRLRATLQRLYDAHRGAAAGQPLSIVVIQRAADPGPYILESGQTTDPAVVAWIKHGPDEQRASGRPTLDAAQQPIKLNW
jgi:hypothetical protein